MMKRSTRKQRKPKACCAAAIQTRQGLQGSFPACPTCKRPFNVGRAIMAAVLDELESSLDFDGFERFAETHHVTLSGVTAADLQRWINEQRDCYAIALPYER